MSGDPKNPIVGELAIDAGEVRDLVKDYAAGTVGHRREKPGLDRILPELNAFMAKSPEERAAAGVNEADVSRALALTQEIARVKKFLPAASKLTEMLEESIDKREDEREGLIGDIAAAVDRKTMRGSQADLVVQFEETRAYRSAVAVKAAKTRRERAAAATDTTSTPVTPEGPGEPGGDS